MRGSYYQLWFSILSIRILAPGHHEGRDVNCSSPSPLIAFLNILGPRKHLLFPTVISWDCLNCERLESRALILTSAVFQGAQDRAGSKEPQHISRRTARSRRCQRVGCRAHRHRLFRRWGSRLCPACLSWQSQMSPNHRAAPPCGREIRKVLPEEPPTWITAHSLAGHKALLGADPTSRPATIPRILHPSRVSCPHARKALFPAHIYLLDNSKSCLMTVQHPLGWLKSQKLTIPNVGGRWNNRTLAYVLKGV